MSREEMYLVEEYGSSASTDSDLHENVMKRKATKEWTSNHTSSEQFRTRTGTRSTDADTAGTGTGTDTDYAIEEGKHTISYDHEKRKRRILKCPGEQD